MSKAYIRICIDAGRETGVRDTLRNFDRIKSAEVTAGQQDLIALIEHDSYEHILDFIVEEIRDLDGVKTSWTNMVLE